MAEQTRIPGDHVLNRAFDRETDTLKTQLMNADIAIELSAEDGDSVIAKKEHTAQSITSGDIIDVSGMSKAAVYLIGNTTELKIEASPLSSGDVFITIHAASTSNSVVIKDICAERLKITSDTGDLHLVLQG